MAAYLTYILNHNKTSFKPIKAVLIRVLLEDVARTDFEDEVAQVLGRHLDGDVDPLAGAVLSCHDPCVAPHATCNMPMLVCIMSFVTRNVLNYFYIKFLQVEVIHLDQSVKMTLW